MDEILFELKDHMSGLNAGRWDYLFSLIKKLRAHADVLPDRGQVTMTVPFMRAYAELLVKTCHRRGAHAMGGMAPFIPTRKDAEVNERALAKVRADKDREVADGFDGTWVAHPDLVPTAWEVFEKAFGTKPNQKEQPARGRRRRRAEADGPRRARRHDHGRRPPPERERHAPVPELVAPRETAPRRSTNLMEDAATAEISRAQLWQWINRKATLADGRIVTKDLYRQVRDEELPKVGGLANGRMKEAVEILDRLVLDDTFAEFLTLPAYAYLE